MVKSLSVAVHSSGAQLARQSTRTADAASYFSVGPPHHRIDVRIKNLANERDSSGGFRFALGLRFTGIARSCP